MDPDVQENEDQGDTRRAFQKVLVEMQELREKYAALRAEVNDRSAGWTEQGPGKAREEVLLNQIQQLEEQLKQVETQSGWSGGMPGRESSDHAVISSNEIFSGLIKMYLDDKRIPQSNDSADADVVFKAGITAQRRRSQSRSGRSSYSGSEPPLQFVDPTRSSDGSGDQHVQGWYAELARDVHGLPPIWLLALFRNQKWRKFSEVVRLLDKDGVQNEPLLSKMTEEAFHAYVNSKELQNDFQKLIPLLQQTASSITEPYRSKLPSTSGNIKDRHSIPSTLMNNLSQSMDGKLKRPSSLSSQVLL